MEHIHISEFWKGFSSGMGVALYIFGVYLHLRKAYSSDDWSDNTQAQKIGITAVIIFLGPVIWGFCLILQLWRKSKHSSWLRETVGFIKYVQAYKRVGLP